MDEGRRYWFNLQAAIIVAVLTAALAAVFQDVPLQTGLLRAVLICVAGLAALSLARTVLDPGDPSSAPHSPIKSRVNIAIAAAIIAASSGGLLMTIGRSNPPSPPAAADFKPVPVRDAVHELAEQLANKTWAMEGESCATDGLRITIDDDDLVVSPRGDPSRRYLLFGANGQQLILRSGNSPVFLELRNDGFTLIEGENTQWFGLCS